MAKGATGVNTGTVIRTKTKKARVIEYNKQRKKIKRAKKCISCTYNKEGFCTTQKEWCSLVNKEKCEFRSII